MAEPFVVEALAGDPPGLRLHGELDLDRSDEFDAALDQLLAQAPQSLVLDLHELRFLGSVGLSSLLRVRSVVGEVTLRGCRPSIRRIIEMSGLDRFFEFDDG